MMTATAKAVRLEDASAEATAPRHLVLTRARTQDRAAQPQPYGLLAG